LLAIGNRMPGWVTSGYAEFAKRMPRECQLQLVEIQAPAKNRALPVAKRMAAEARALNDKLPARVVKVALDERGKPWTSTELAAQLQQWMASGRDIALFIGGADGLDAQFKSEADLLWSLSPLTLPHALVRVVVAEQLYRAWTILNNHPYHRE